MQTVFCWALEEAFEPKDAHGMFERSNDLIGCMFLLMQDTRWNFDTKFVAKCDDTECLLNIIESVLDWMREIQVFVKMGGRKKTH